VTWICTDWFRSNAYYRSSAWRATWKGEGGGILLNQCPHNLDLLQWILGMMPVRIRAACALGKWHPIEVEDDVTAYLEYPNGATGTFIASTGEAPGVNLLAISGDRGCVRLEHGRIHFTRNVMATSRFNKTTSGCFSSPERWEIEIPVSGNGGQHNEIIQNFVNAILHGETLKAPAEEGIRSVELANAMLYSSLTGKTIELPLNASAYEKTLKGLIANSRGRKKTVRPSAPVDMRKSFR
jgi:predicted dehydrogenase